MLVGMSLECLGRVLEYLTLLDNEPAPRPGQYGPSGTRPLIKYNLACGSSRPSGCSSLGVLATL